MKINMDDSRIISITQIQDFLKASQKIPFLLCGESIEKKYQFIDETLKVQVSTWKVGTQMWDNSIYLQHLAI